MEVPQKTWNHHEKKKMVIKVGGGAAAVGFGAVVLLGGALATAALASALIVGKKGWSSSKDRRRSRRHQSPPPEMRKQNEQDEANKGQQFVISHVYDHPSNGPTKEVESDNNSGLLVSTRSSSLDEKPRIEISGGKPGDAADASEETLGSISPKKLENNAVSAVVEEGFSSLDARLPFEPKNLMHESELGIHLTKEDFANEIPEESKISEQIHIEEVGPEREARDDVEIEGINHREACVVTQIQPRGEQNREVCYDQAEIEVTIVDNAVEGVHIDRKEIEELTIVDNAIEGVHIDPKEIEVTKAENAVEGNHIDQKEGQNVEEKELEDLCGDSKEISKDVCEEAIQKTEENVGTSTISSLSETMASEIHSEDGEKPLLSVLESPVVEHEHVNRDEGESGIVGIIQEDDTGEGSRDLVKEQEKCDQPDEGMIQEKREELGLTGEANQSNLQIEVGEPKIPSEKKEENASTDHPIPTPTENRDFGVPVLKEELISPEDVEVTKEDAANEEVAESLEVNENTAPIQSTISQPTDSGDDVESNIQNEVEGELISPENTEAAKEYFANEQVAENVDVNENKTSLQLDVDEPNQHEDDLDRKTVEEAEDSSETINTRITAAKEVNENNTSIQSAFCQPKDSEDDIDRNTEKEVQEELISPENTEATTEDFANEEVAENLEVDENKTFEQFVIGQPKQHEDDVQGDDAGEVEDSSVITDKGIAATEDDSVMEMNEDGEKEITVNFVVGQPKQHEDVEGVEVADSSVIINTGEAATKDDSVMEMNENDEDNDETSEQFVVGQPKQHEDNVEENTAEEVEDSSVIIDRGIATEKEDSFIGMNENDEKGEDNVKDFQDETYSSDEVEESSEETGDSSTESNSDAVWPAESRQEASMEPQQVKLIDQEVEGKIQEDKAGRDGENDFQKIKANGENSYFEARRAKAGGRNSNKSSENFPTVVDSSHFPDGKGESEKTFIKKYVANASRRMMLIAALSVLSSLLCSWFFGLSSMKLCLIAFLTMILAKIHGY